MTSPPAQPQSIRLSANDYDGAATISWTRSDAADRSDPGTWEGDPIWVARAQDALATRAPITVLAPDVTYEFPPFTGDVDVADIAAAIIAAVAGRGDVSDLLDHLPAYLFDGADDPNVIY